MPGQNDFIYAAKVARTKTPAEAFYWLGTRPDVSYGLEVALGNIAGVSKVNKFGLALDCDSGIPTDIWDGADGTTSTDIWAAPTQARIHNLVSTSVEDDGDGTPLTGMRTIRIYGLKTWASKESSEDVILEGQVAVATANAYVIIHRMIALTFGSAGTNVGIITATAVTDATVTAAIQAGEGQTLMLIYGVPSVQTFHMTNLAASGVGVGATTEFDATLLVKENADQSDAGFVTKEKFLFSNAVHHDHTYDPPKSFTGPCIVKLQVSSDTANADGIGSFEAYVVDN